MLHDDRIETELDIDRIFSHAGRSNRKGELARGFFQRPGKKRPANWHRGIERNWPPPSQTRPNNVRLLILIKKWFSKKTAEEIDSSGGLAESLPRFRVYEVGPRGELRNTYTHLDR